MMMILTKRAVALLGALGSVAGCVVAEEPVGIAGQEQACAGEYAQMIDVPMASVRVNGHDESPAGNTVIFLQTADNAHSANCEVDDYGTVVAIEKTRG